jgi:hypothetical protein
LIMYIKLINKYLLEDTDIYGNELYNFLKSDKIIDFLPNTIFVNIPKNALICGRKYLDSELEEDLKEEKMFW